MVKTRAALPGSSENAWHQLCEQWSVQVLNRNGSTGLRKQMEGLLFY